MQKNLNIEKIIFKVVQIKFLAMHITNQILSSAAKSVKSVISLVCGVCLEETLIMQSYLCLIGSSSVCLNKLRRTVSLLQRR